MKFTAVKKTVIVKHTVRLLMIAFALQNTLSIPVWHVASIWFRNNLFSLLDEVVSIASNFNIDLSHIFVFTNKLDCREKSSYLI